MYATPKLSTWYVQIFTYGVMEFILSLSTHIPYTHICACII